MSLSLDIPMTGPCHVTHGTCLLVWQCIMRRFIFKQALWWQSDLFTLDFACSIGLTSDVCRNVACSVLLWKRNMDFSNAVMSLTGLLGGNLCVFIGDACSYILGFILSDIKGTTNGIRYQMRTFWKALDCMGITTMFTICSALFLHCNKYTLVFSTWCRARAAYIPELWIKHHRENAVYHFPTDNIRSTSTSLQHSPMFQNSTTTVFFPISKVITLMWSFTNMATIFVHYICRLWF